MTPCLGWNNEHKFEPRYSVYEHELTISYPKMTVEGSNIADLRSLLVRQDRVYQGDVCVKCGMHSDSSVDLAGRKVR